MNRRGDDNQSQQQHGYTSKIQNGDSTKIANGGDGGGSEQRRRSGKKKKWTFGGLFRRRKTKNSDSDSVTTESESGEKGFFSRPRRHNGNAGCGGGGGSYPVKNEFETRIIKRDNNGGHDDDFVEYNTTKTSPKNVIKTTPTITSSRRQIVNDSIGGDDSLETIGRLTERQKAKARIEARHLRLKNDTSDSEDNDTNRVAKLSFNKSYGNSQNYGASAGNNYSNDQLLKNVAKKSRTARTNRYLQRHGLPDAVLNRQSQWVTNPIYQHDDRRNNHRYVPKAFSAVTSPVSSPVTNIKNRYDYCTIPYSKCDSLYGRVWSYPQLTTSSPPPPSLTPPSVKCSSSIVTPPPPPPRNPNRKITYAIGGDAVNRPLSYAFDNRIKSNDIDVVADKSSSQNLRELSKPGEEENSLKRYRADKHPRSRNPIRLITTSDDVETTSSIKSDVVKNNKIVSRVKSNDDDDDEKRSRKSRNERLSKQKPKNLEEALLELEEIYNSLQLSDEDLLERADRRDLQSAIRSNPNFSRYSCSDLDNDDTIIKNRNRSIAGLLSPINRRSVIPDKIHDDMAYRKLRRKCKNDTKLTPNIVSQSGSFLLVSPALSPPPLIDVPPPSQTTSLLAQLNGEPDVTLDDVVFRNLKHSNDTLRVQDPQPPFGIPLGYVSTASNSDYLHATPSDKYRSTFNPSRMPDLVKDDLAYRNLRKDAQNGQQQQQQLPTSIPSIRDTNYKTIKSLSANTIGPVKKKNVTNEEKLNHCSSFNDLPDVLQVYRSQQKELLRNCDECLTIDDDDDTKLKNTPPFTRRRCSNTSKKPEKEIFVKRVAIHKPVTLSRFNKFVDDDVDTNRTNMVKGSTAADELVENSSSGVSSKSETPDSAVKMNSSTRVIDNLYESIPPIRLRCERAENGKDKGRNDKTTAISTPVTRQTNRIEITLSTPQEAGTILSEILAEFTPNFNLLVFAGYVIAFLHQWLFTSFSICEIFTVLIALVAFYFINER